MCMYGGVMLVCMLLQEQDIYEKDVFNLLLKDSIGVYVVWLVKLGDNIIIDFGLIIMMLVCYLCGYCDVMVMINGLNIVWELVNVLGVELLLIGGLLCKQLLLLQGSQVEVSLNIYSFDILFFGVDGLDLQFGLIIYYEVEVSFNYCMVECVCCIVVLIDVFKFGCVSLYCIVWLDQVYIIIIDVSIDSEYLDGLQWLGVEVIIVELFF